MPGPIQSNITLPLRKRRRLALSCVECRRRKIKCDRNDPCNHCKQSPGITCVYHQDARPASGISQKANSNLPTAAGAVQDIEITGKKEVSAVVPSQSGASIPIELYLQSVEEKLYLAPQGGNRNECVALQDAAFGSQAPNLSNSNRPEGKKSHYIGLSFSTFNEMIINDGNGQSKLRTKISPNSDLKMYFYGQSHWKHSLGQFLKIISVGDSTSLRLSIDETNLEIRHLLESCKIMARSSKAVLASPSPWHANLNCRDYFPVRDVADKLVRNYFRTMECTHRILHIPSFHREYEGYWSDPQRASTLTVVKILLVLAIGTRFYQEEDSPSLRTLAQRWVYSVQSWVSAPLERARLNLSGLQVQCLLFLARESTAVGAGLGWVTAGSLLRTAFQMGCHRDPKYFPRMSIMHGELRRRLWATVLEITIQTSLDSGMPPLISINDFDTAPPSNINDEDILWSTLVLPTPKPPNVFTQTSMQIQLLKSLPTRYRVTHQINDFNSEPPYDEVLRLGNEINTACKEAAILMNQYPLSLHKPTVLQRNHLDLFIRRFLLSVHRPFALKSHNDAKYYFSRKLCLDTALIMMSYSHSSLTQPGLPPGHLDDYTQLVTVGGGIFKDAIMYAGTIICFELIQQLDEESANGLGLSASGKIAREPLHNCIRDLVEISTARIALGDNCVKWHLLLCATMGQVRAMEKGSHPKQAMLEATRVGARACLELLRARMKVPDTGETHFAEEFEMPELDVGLEYDFSNDLTMQDQFTGLDFEPSDTWDFF